MRRRKTPVGVSDPGPPTGARRGFGFAEYAPLRRVLMHAPGEEIDRIDLETFRRYLFEDAVEPELFRAQHKALVDVLRSEGVEVVLVEEILRDSQFASSIRRSPNLVYMRDTVAVTQAGAVTMRMRSPIRRAEPAIATAALAKLHVPTFTKIRAPATMEGGDVIFLDEETLLVGVGNRTNGAGVRQLRSKAAAALKTVVTIPLPRWAIHLDGTMIVLDADLVVAHRESLLRGAIVYQQGKAPRRTQPLSFLRRRGLRILDVTAYERQRRASNFVTLGPRKVVGYAGHARLRKEMSREGVDLIEVEGSELVRGGGGPRCLTAPIEREVRGSLHAVETRERQDP